MAIVIPLYNGRVFEAMIDEGIMFLHNAGLYGVPFCPPRRCREKQILVQWLRCIAWRGCLLSAERRARSCGDFDVVTFAVTRQWKAVEVSRNQSTRL
jgi:hypothetical protein